MGEMALKNETIKNKLNKFIYSNSGQIDFIRLYSTISSLRKNSKIRWQLEDLQYQEFLYSYLITSTKNKPINKIESNVLQESLLLQTKIRLLLCYFHGSSLKEKEINDLFLTSYNNGSIQSLCQIITLQLQYCSDLISPKMLHKIHKYFDGMQQTSKEKVPVFKELLQHIELDLAKVEKIEIQKYLTDIKIDLNSAIFQYETEKLLSSNGTEQNFEYYFQEIEHITPYKKTDAKLLEKALDFLTITEINERKQLQWMYQLRYLSRNVSQNVSSFAKIKQQIQSGQIVLDNAFPDYSFSYQPPNVQESVCVITIDPAYSLDLDGAFSVKKENDLYILDFYITDVPSILMNHDDLYKLAYERATSMYIAEGNSQIALNMLPTELATTLLSLRQNSSHRVIDFTVTVGSKGQIYNIEVSRKNIYISKNMTPEEAEFLSSTSHHQSPYVAPLKLYKKACDAIINRTDSERLLSLKNDVKGKLVGLPSILINTYIAQNSQFAIYRQKGRYSREVFSDPYVHSVAPLRRFGDDINLAFFLEQLGIVSYDDKKLHEIEKNVDSIIAHLNEREEIAKCIQFNPSFAKKYVRF